MMPTVIENPRSKQSGATGFLVPKWVDSASEARHAASSDEEGTVWIVRKSNLVDSVAHEVAVIKALKKSGYLVLLLDARSALLPPLEKRFRAVAFVPRALSKEEFDEVLTLPDREDRFIGGIVDEASKTLTLWRGNFKSITVPFSAFPATGNGIKPDFKKFSVIDYGHTLKFGNYESASEVVLFEYAPDFRRRLKQTRFAEEKTLGASIRRLRRQRRLTRGDFGNIDAKTIARIEHGKVKRPQASTLEGIANVLGVNRSQLSSY
jgi:hypothetical protein